MLVQNDPFRYLDSLFDTRSPRRTEAPRPLPMDAYRRGDNVWVHVDLPGVSSESIEVGIERNVLTVTARRGWSSEDDDKVYINERRTGTFTRQIHLGEGLDADAIEADYHDGVLTLRVPVAEQAKPKRIAINASIDHKAIEEPEMARPADA